MDLLVIQVCHVGLSQASGSKSRGAQKSVLQAVGDVP